MENASKALLITAAVLIVIIIVALGVKLLGGISNTKEQTEKVEEGISSSIEKTTKKNIKVVLQKSGTNKTATIQLINKIMQCGLKNAQNICNNPPQTIKEGITEAEAEKIKKDFENIGATVTIEKTGGIFDQFINQEEDVKKFKVILKQCQPFPHIIQYLTKIMEGSDKKPSEVLNNLPQTLKENITEEEAKSIKNQLEYWGATVEIKEMP